MLASAYTLTARASEHRFNATVNDQHTVSIDLHNYDYADRWKEAEHIAIIGSQTGAEDIQCISKE